jgi:hypothetical protein
MIAKPILLTYGDGVSDIDINETKDELPMSAMGIVFHDVPENRLTSNRHHWLGAKFRFLTQPGALASAQNNDLHPESPTTG